jgi:hypothetical protein
LLGFDKITAHPSDYEATYAAQSKTEGEYEQSVHTVINAMASDVAGEFTKSRHNAR